MADSYRLFRYCPKCKGEHVDGNPSHIWPDCPEHRNHLPDCRSCGYFQQDNPHPRFCPNCSLVHIDLQQAHVWPDCPERVPKTCEGCGFDGHEVNFCGEFWDKISLSPLRGAIPPQRLTYLLEVESPDFQHLQRQIDQLTNHARQQGDRTRQVEEQNRQQGERTRQLEEQNHQLWMQNRRMAAGFERMASDLHDFFRHQANGSSTTQSSRGSPTPSAIHHTPSEISQDLHTKELPSINHSRELDNANPSRLLKLADNYNKGKQRMEVLEYQQTHRREERRIADVNHGFIRREWAEKVKNLALPVVSGDRLAGICGLSISSFDAAVDIEKLLKDRKHTVPAGYPSVVYVMLNDIRTPVIPTLPWPADRRKQFREWDYTDREIMYDAIVNYPIPNVAEQEEHDQLTETGEEEQPATAKIPTVDPDTAKSMAKHLKNSDSKTFRCVLHPQKKFNYRQLMTHMDSHHAGEKIRQCPFCPESAFNAKQFDEHINNHDQPVFPDEGGDSKGPKGFGEMAETGSEAGDVYIKMEDGIPSNLYRPR